jgi:hypothetical protein
MGKNESGSGPSPRVVRNKTKSTRRLKKNGGKSPPIEFVACLVAGLKRERARIILEAEIISLMWSNSGKEFASHAT